ncbi:MAG: Uma2 family endonuclease [Candidatus Tectomicrobia bacterium]|nr:Uma2 family endonuclease [Candidatus Tectomicrobia bacterium]
MAEKRQGTKPLLTAKELSEMGEESEFCELVDGELVRMSPSFLPEARVVRTIFLLLGTFVLQHRLGEVFGPDLGYELTPHRVRAPDVSFISAEKLAAYGNPQEFAKVVPDLAVEVISPEVKYGYLQRKIRDYFEAGVRLLGIVDPEMQTVTVHRSPLDLRVFTAADTLSGEDVIPGFSCPIAELFA